MKKDILNQVNRHTPSTKEIYEIEHLVNSNSIIIKRSGKDTVKFAYKTQIPELTSLEHKLYAFIWGTLNLFNNLLSANNLFSCFRNTTQATSKTLQYGQVN